ncbi:hypothetical protein BVC80_9021g23 [Macleaya cordata]|uniref:MULE transposase domain-containing protein n=1 Tax=Macleaya cordata TaxID=56857 RepID=A0A200QUY7_MACCD|nr:hypothetical protein BVC80_9021g23 [Macleaya cordata]
MEENGTVMEIPSKEEDHSSNNSFLEGIGSSNPIQDLQSNPSEVDERPVDHPHKYTDIVEQAIPILEVGIDLTQCFNTDKVFDSREEVIHWCQEVGKKNKTVLVISKSVNKPAGKGSIIELGCERGGVYKTHKKKDYKPKTGLKRKRESSSKKCGCPFKLRSRCIAENKWNLRVRCGSHNHEVANSLTGHAYVARLKEDEEQLVVQLTASGARPREVLTALKERNKDNHSTIRTIYNARARLRLHETEGRPIMQQVIKLSTQYHYVEWHRRDEEMDEVKDIFWAHPESTLLAQCFPSVLMVDFTYKTNRFKVPLLHVVGVTSTGRSFTVAYAFIDADTEEHFSWALTQLKSLFSPNNLPSVFITDREPALMNAIDVVFPGASRLLCTSHMTRDVVASCKKAFEENDEMWNDFFRDWESLWKAKTKDEYMNAFADFLMAWVARYPACIAYLRDTWLVHKEQFVLAWTQKIKHFGNTTIDRVESEHGQLKKHLGSSLGNFIVCWEAMHNMINNQIVQIKASFEKSLTMVKHEHHAPAFDELRNHVSHHALELIQLELNRLEDVDIDVTSCMCMLRSTHGLPCAHELIQYANEGRPIRLSAIDPQWKQLSVVPLVEKRIDFDFLPEVQLLRQRWIEAPEPERCSLVQKIKEIAMPKTGVGNILKSM